MKMTNEIIKTRDIFILTAFVSAALIVLFFTAIPTVAFYAIAKVSATALACVYALWLMKCTQ